MIKKAAPGKHLPCRLSAGFTLMELLMGIAVFAILTTLAVPAFNQFILNNRLAGQANEMVAAFQFARSEAIKRGEQVQVCSSADGSTCGGGWNQGWITMADPAGSPEVLRVWQSPGSDFAFTPANGTVIFDRSGFISGAAQQLDLKLSGSTEGNDRRVLIERTGRIASCRIDEPPCAN